MSSITDLLTAPEKGFAGAATSFVLGTVSENGNKNFAGMVKVEFTLWQQGENISQWLPVLSSYAGKQHGAYCIPEVGDIVLVGFVGPMLEQPFVLGSFFPAGAALPKEQTHEKNMRRTLKTKGGITIATQDEEGEQRLAATTPKGLCLAIDDKAESISLADKEGKNQLVLNCKSGEVAITAKQKITLKAGNCEVTMDAGSGALTLKCDQLKIEAGQTATVKSGNLLKLEGGVLTAEAKQQLALKGNALCEISGGIVKIN